jgi:antitoxin HicB
MERNFEYPAKIEQDEAGFYLVTFPDFPEAATDARSLNDALAMAADCLEEAVAGRMKRGDDIPAPSVGQKGMVLIALPALYALKAALYLAMREVPLSQKGLATRLGKQEKVVQQLLDPAHISPVSALEQTLRLLGKQVRVAVADASR